MLNCFKRLPFCTWESCACVNIVHLSPGVNPSLGASISCISLFNTCLSPFQLGRQTSADPKTPPGISRNSCPQEHRAGLGLLQGIKDIWIHSGRWKLRILNLEGFLHLHHGKDICYLGEQRNTLHEHFLIYSISVFTPLCFMVLINSRTVEGRSYANLCVIISSQQ